MKVAIVHYWLVTMRGGEKVLEELCLLYPQADIFTLVLDPACLSPTLKKRRIFTSVLQRLPGSVRHYQKLLPLMPFALEHFDLSAYDLVISSESGPAKGIVTRPDALHVCYCHSPMRYIWDHYHVYRRELGRVGRAALFLCAPFLRVWDVSTSMRVDAFVANSVHVSRRIHRVYGRSSVVVYPPVAVDDFTPVPAPSRETYLCAGQLVSYKRIDLAVRAFTTMAKPLVVIGEGPQFDELRRKAGPTIRFLGRCDFATLRDHLQNCRALVFPGEEDFGILPVEAMACGRPVIAYGAGGALESVGGEAAGVFFSEQTEASLIEAVGRFEARESEFDPVVIRRRAQLFSPQVFASRMKAFVDHEIARKRAAFALPEPRLDVPHAYVAKWAADPEDLDPAALNGQGHNDMQEVRSWR